MAIKKQIPSKQKHRINEQIRANEVRLVGVGDGAQIVSLEEALAMAREQTLDLVEISNNQDPPVVKIVDYSKFRFEQIKKNKEAKKKQKVIHVKEIKLRPNIDVHDFTHKVRHAKDFLEKGDKVKFTVMFRGREIVHTDLGFRVLENVQKELDGFAVIERMPVKEGRNITMIMAPHVLEGSKPKKKVQEGEEQA